MTMSNQHIDVIATTISGSIKDWSKVGRIVPLFAEHGWSDVNLVAVNSHSEAQRQTAQLVKEGSRIVISAGGSGTFNAVLEGIYEANVDMTQMRLGFLRKGSADLIGKVLQMPDEIEEAIDVFVHSIKNDRVIPCDILEAVPANAPERARRFVGYGGAELFGEIPRFTENRFMKYYKGVLSQLFGDKGPFAVGTGLTIAARFFRNLGRSGREWEILCDGRTITSGRFQSLIIVNGDLGKDLPFAKGAALGSGDFYLITIRDLGQFKLIGQLKKSWDASIMDYAQEYGFEKHLINDVLTMKTSDRGLFPLNVDGSILECNNQVTVRIVNQIQLLKR